MRVCDAHQYMAVTVESVVVNYFCECGTRQALIQTEFISVPASFVSFGCFSVSCSSSLFTAFDSSVLLVRRRSFFSFRSSFLFYFDFLSSLRPSSTDR